MHSCFMFDSIFILYSLVADIILASFAMVLNPCTVRMSNKINVASESLEMDNSRCLSFCSISHSYACPVLTVIPPYFFEIFILSFHCSYFYAYVISSRSLFASFQFVPILANFLLIIKCCPLY